ncbi:LysR family transcriptional regulator [Streptomyces griseocarneus]|uniref:LysR family transcriptional regulator n=1 Tax=Streptomyces griseocarneus TaxID=51201 RepID=UPI0019B81677|nr:LysR family transcriptional regulator [Streptomyces griseocarneus]MBZ6472324.1 LysR family transcriptional regulator [Streptomyces griseocarneus]GHG72620.1 LysR family transcriptional regulator [Streptomyces griseocarneus]
MRRLQYFVAVAEEGNVGRAARRLLMSQPPLSQRIRELEADLGCALFVRTPQGMTLTPPGEVLLEEARRLLEGVERARDLVRRAAGQRVLRVGVVGPGEAALSASMAHAFTRRHDDVEVTLVQGDLSDPTVGLPAGNVDAAITFTPFTRTGLSTRTVRQDRCYAAVPASSPLADAAVLSRADLRGHLSVRLADGTDPLFRAHWQPGTSLEGPVVRSMDECLHAVLWRKAVALVPEQVVRGHPVEGIAYVPVGDLPPADLVVAWRRSDRNPLVAHYVDAFCAAVAPSHP